MVADPPYQETTLKWDRWPAGWLDALALAVPVSAPLWCFGSMRMFFDRLGEFAAAGWRHAQEIVWEKHNGSNSTGDRFRRVHEFAVQWYRGAWEDVPVYPVMTNDATARTVRRKEKPAHWGDIGSATYESTDGGPRLARSVMYVRSMHGRAIHRTEKPTGILRPLIEYSTRPGDIVFDPFAGSCSTLVAARQLGRRAIGIESDEAMCEKAVTARLAHPVDRTPGVTRSRRP